MHACLRSLIENRPITFLTLTIRHNNEPLNDLLNHLMASFKRLRQTALWEERVEGGAAFIEVKRTSENTGWHPHLHIIMDARYLPFEELQDAWKVSSKGSFRIDIQRVKDSARVQGYVTKYVTKALDGSYMRDANLLDEAVLALKGRRLCHCFGTWYGTALHYAEDAQLADDIIDAGGWHQLGTLQEIFADARAGNSRSRAILERLGAAQRFPYLLFQGDTS